MKDHKEQHSIQMWTSDRELLRRLVFLSQQGPDGETQGELVGRLLRQEEARRKKSRAKKKS